MSDLIEVLERSIEKVSGANGLKKFKDAVDKGRMEDIIKKDGTPDLLKLMYLLLDTFPEDIASGIMDETLSQYGKQKSPADGPVNMDEAPMRAPSGEAYHADAITASPDLAASHQSFDVFEAILQDLIMLKAGPDGLEKYLAKMNGHAWAIASDGSPDRFMLMNILLDVFSEDMASGIMDDAILKYKEKMTGMMSGDRVGPLYQASSVPEYPHDSLEGTETDNAMINEKLARYFNKDANEVRDLVNEARKIRTAMGKPDHSHQPVREQNHDAGDNSIAHTAVSPPMTTSVLGPALTLEDVDMETDRFINSHGIPSSIEIMDFTRYLKDKGYIFQDNTILEKIYTKVEERKSNIRAMIAQEIGKFLVEKPRPSEEDVSIFIEQLRKNGIKYDGYEIRQMIFIEMIRNA